MNAHRFKDQFPDKYFLTEEISDVSEYLHSLSFLAPEEQVLSAQKPGEGNMNKVLRVKTNHRSFIVKQARPWVEKYPAIDAPVERNKIEGQYYARIQNNPQLSQYSPNLLFQDLENLVMILSDLGDGADFLWMYERIENLQERDVLALVHYLNELHQVPVTNFPDNLSMRKLNHEHIFHFPFLIDNGFDLDELQPGLQSLKQKYASNQQLVHAITNLGSKYLASGIVLLHGDFYPGSWIRTSDGLKVIDPEFCFPGFQEFDLGVFLAHLQLTDQPTRYSDLVFKEYAHQSDENLTRKIAGVEILRRLIGVAQLPLKISLDVKEALMDKAVNWILA